VSNPFKPQDHYFNEAKKHGYVARSAFKLQEIDEKYQLFGHDTKSVIDIGCSPWSWIQYAHRVTKGKAKIVWLDLKPSVPNLENVHTYVCDATNIEQWTKIFEENTIGKVDVIMSDLAPNTTGLKDIDALKCIGILEDTLWIYRNYLKHDGKFAIKIFMWPWFEEFVKECKNIWWANNIRVFKPKACRSISKETYVVKWK
jgi:23S rRNA (uridine2552-2'-O)-methyltransferase